MQLRNAFHSCTSKSNTLFPDLTNFRHTSPCRNDRDHGLQRELHTTGRAPNGYPRTVVADSQIVNCDRFSYQQVIHILRSLQAPQWVLHSDRRRQVDPIEMPGSRLSQVSSPCQTGTSMTRSKTSQPSLQTLEAY